MKMRRIDYLLNAKDPIGVLLEEFDLDLKCHVCNHYKGCDVCDTDCDEAFIEYLEEDIEVNAKETLQETLDKVKETLQKTLDKVKEPVEDDPVNHPSHYTDTKIEVMDYIEDKQLNFARGNVIKYVSRAGKKDPNKELEDLKKAMWYLNREIERLSKEE